MGRGRGRGGCNFMVNLLQPFETFSTVLATEEDNTHSIPTFILFSNAFIVSGTPVFACLLNNTNNMAFFTI